LVAGGKHFGLALSLPPRSGLTTTLEILCSSKENVYVSKTNCDHMRDNRFPAVNIMAFDVGFLRERSILKELQLIEYMVNLHLPKFVVVAGYRTGCDDIIGQWILNNSKFSSIAKINLPFEFCPVSNTSMGVDERMTRGETLHNCLPSNISDTLPYGAYNWMMNGRQEPKGTSFGGALYKL
jgi:hypothetical protein